MTADAELIALCERLVALRRQECLICTEDPLAPDEGPQHARFEAVLDEQNQMEKRIYDTPEPVSSDGCQAVARAALVGVPRDNSHTSPCGH